MYKIGQRVRRNPALWPASKYPANVNNGKIVGRKGAAFLFLSDSAAKGEHCYFTNKRVAGTPTPYLASELVKA